MKKKHFFYSIVWFVFLLVLSGCQDEKANVWAFELTNDQEAYIITDYLGEDTKVVLPETYQGKPVIGLKEDFTFPYEVEDITLSKNLETFYENRNLYLSLDAFHIPEDSKLKSIGCNVRFEHSVFKTFYIPKDLELCVESFFEAYALESFLVHKDNPYYEEIDGVLYNETGKELLYMPMRYQVQTFSIPNGVERINDQAFFLQKSIDHVFVPETVHEIGAYAFAFSNIESVTFSEETTIQDLGYMAFRETYEMKHFDVPDSVTVLKSTFAESHIETIGFGEDSKLEKISHGTFERTPYLKSLILPKDLFEISGAPFSHSALESLTFLSDITHFEDRVFSQMDHIKDINFLVDQSEIMYENGVMTRNQGKKIFYYQPEDESIKTFYVHEHIEEISRDLLFEHGHHIEHFEVDPNNLYLISIDGVVYSKDLKTLKYYPSASKDLTYSIRYGTEKIERVIIPIYLKTLYIPETVIEIERFGFGNGSIEKVVFLGESKLVAIPENAFYSSNLKEIIIPKSVKTIGESAFHDSTLEKLSFEEGSELMFIGYHAFGNTLLSSVILPDHAMQVRYGAFNTSTLKHVYIQHKDTIIEESAFDLNHDTTFYLKGDFPIDDMSIFGRKSVIISNVSMSFYLILSKEDVS